VTVQEDGKAFIWNGNGSVIIEGPSANLEEQLRGGALLSIDWRIDAENAAPAQLFFGDKSVSLTEYLRNAPVGTISNLSIPLACFVRDGADLANVGTAFRLEAEAGLALTLMAVRIDSPMQKAACPTVVD